VTVFSSPAEELTATQVATDELLKEIAASEAPVSETVLIRLENLANACARLAYPNDLPLSVVAHNLITWCDHLNEPVWKSEFISALNVYPLGAPWPRA